MNHFPNFWVKIPKFDIYQPPLSTKGKNVRIGRRARPQNNATQQILLEILQMKTILSSLYSTTIRVQYTKIKHIAREI